MRIGTAAALLVGLVPGFASAQDVVTPPRVVTAPDPVYPESEVPRVETVRVGLDVVIDREGRIRDVHVIETAGAAFDAAALEAVAHWVFEPATRDGVPFTSRVRIAVSFTLPRFDAPPPAAEPEPRRDDAPTDEEGAQSTAGGAESEPTREQSPPHRPDAHDPAAQPPEGDEHSAEAHVHAPVTTMGSRDAGQYVVSRAALEIAPQTDAGAMLRVAPGFVVTRPEGDAVAHRIMLRGFDADHGQDVELRVEGLPINQPSHLHGQGYADLGFVLPEVVRSIRVQEGVYDPRQGDFAVAGTADFSLGVARRGLYAGASGGSFRTFRQVLVVAPRNEDEGTFFAVDARQTAGFGRNRSGIGSSALGSYVVDTGAMRLRFLVAGSGARADLAGVVRRDDLSTVGWYGVYDTPTARAQNASSARGMLAMIGEHADDDGSLTRFAIQGGLVDFRAQTNFTGYTQISRVDPNWRGRGDLVEQTNRDASLTFQLDHRTRTYEPADWLDVTVTAGTSVRLNRVHQLQNLLVAPQNEIWDRRVDADITATDVALHAETTLDFTELATLRLGVRADGLYYGVDDHLGNFVPAYRREDYVVGYRRSAAGFVGGPRASLELHPARGPRWFFAYGEGYRSPQAIALQDGERAPFTKVRSADVGLRHGHDGEHAGFRATLSGFYTHLSDDLIFEPSENRYERIGASRRAGLTGSLDVDAFDVLDARLSITAVRATLLDPPPATAEDPDPPFRPGELLPYVPQVVGRADLGASHRFTGKGVHLRAGLSGSLVGPRPLPYGQRSAPYLLLDAQTTVEWRSITVGLTVQNLANARYAASEYYFVSRWDPSEVGSRIPERHIAAGAPRAFGITLGIRP